MKEGEDDGEGFRDGDAERAGDAAGALEARGRLLEGLPQGSAEWFEAKCRVIESLIETDPGRAQEALEQHKALFPDLGPPPWDERLRELEWKLKAGGSAAQQQEEVEGVGTGRTPIPPSGGRGEGGTP